MSREEIERDMAEAEAMAQQYAGIVKYLRGKLMELDEREKVTKQDRAGQLEERAQ
jgi:hypothetical protein